jgi:hypothetical protein
VCSASCKSGDGDATETTAASDTSGGCVEPPFAEDAPPAWSFCGCSDASPWYTHCGDGFFCEQAFVYESVPPVVVGGTCSPLCETDDDCAAYPVEGKTVVCGGHHCEILCDAGACAEGWTCQGDNCIETPEG